MAPTIFPISAVETEIAAAFNFRVKSYQEIFEDRRLCHDAAIASTSIMML